MLLEESEENKNESQEKGSRVIEEEILEPVTFMISGKLDYTLKSFFNDLYKNKFQTIN